MALTARLYRDGRGAERFRVEFDATLRDPSHMPLDVVIEDLSTGGFRMLTAADLAAGVEIGLGLAGIGTHRARVVRRENGAYGCEFVEPLTSAGLSVALSAPSTTPVMLPRFEPRSPVPAETALDDRPARKLSVPVRLLAIVICSIAAWMVAIGLGALVLRALA